MKAVIAHSYGAPEDLRIGEAPDPPVGAGEVRVRVQAAAANFVDALVVSGRYQVKPPLPFIPGAEFSGIVDAVGDGVEGLRPGVRVCGSQFGGAYAELVTLPGHMAFEIPDEMSFSQAAIFRASNGTAYHGLVQRAALRPGETVLVLGAGGAVGYSAVQVAKALGARVIASASSAEKRRAAESAGAYAAIESGAADWRDQVRAAAGGEIDVVVDPVGGPLSELAFRCLGWGGRHLVIGFAAGDIPAIRTNLALVKGAALIGVDFRRFNLLEPEAAKANTEQLFGFYRDGRLPPQPVRTYPAEAHAEALSDAASGAMIGRRVLDLSRWP